MMRFEKYERPESLDVAVALTAFYGADAKILAGGTDLIPRLKSGAFTTKVLVDIAKMPMLAVIHKEKEETFFGSMLRLREIQKNETLTGALSVLRSCAGHVSSMQIRNVATLGGNSCNASPSADTVPGLLLLDAQVQLASAKSIRRLSLDDFLIAPGRTAAEIGEIATGFAVPLPPDCTGAAYCKYAIRGDSDISLVGVGAALTIDRDGKISRARLALASVGPRTLRMREAETMLENEMPSAELFDEVAALCARRCTPITDQRATAEYRREMVLVWTKKALWEAAQNTNG